MANYNDVFTGKSTLYNMHVHTYLSRSAVKNNLSVWAKTVWQMWEKKEILNNDSTYLRIYHDQRWKNSFKLILISEFMMKKLFPHGYCLFIQVYKVSIFYHIKAVLQGNRRWIAKQIPPHDKYTRIDPATNIHQILTKLTRVSLWDKTGWLF